MLSAFTHWLTTLSLVFGGCCSNAVTLEQLTLQYPNAGSILTFFQFLFISLYGLPKFLIWTRFGPRFRTSRVPVINYLIQVALFYSVSLLNNAAFAYHIPMAVHIIFRSGGLIISMILGWLVLGRTYSSTQTLSVLLVTAGVILTTFSASKPPSPGSTPIDPYTYAKGIGILTLALVLSGFLGLLQDRISAKYLRGSTESKPSMGQPPAWQESMFYLHFLALPMFYPLLPNIAVQMHTLNTESPRTEFNFTLPIPVTANFTTTFPLDIPPPYSLPNLPIHFFPNNGHRSLVSLTQMPNDLVVSAETTQYPLTLSLSLPQIYLPLVLNTITQLLCVAGVHRLTTRVSALTVTLILVVRKATSLILSVVGFANVAGVFRDQFILSLKRVWDALGFSHATDAWNFKALEVNFNAGFDFVVTALVGAGSKAPQNVNQEMMFMGAAMVLLGTIGYTIGSRPREVKFQSKEKAE